MIRRSVLAAFGVVVIAVEVAISLAMPAVGNAQQTSQVGGEALKVSPVRWDITVDPGETKVIDLYVQNLTDVAVRLHPAINDFVASDDEDGTPKIILEEDKFAPSHSFKRFVKPMSDFSVQPHELKNVKATVVVPKNAAGGGYFGAVRFSPASNSDSDDKNVNLTASVGSLILMKVNGEITEKVSVASFDVRKKTASKTIPDKPAKFFTDNKDLKVVLRVKNEGNVQVGPFGTVIVKKGGKKIDQIQINNQDPRQQVLPDSVRRFEVDMTKIGSFGKYTVEGSFGYGSAGELITTSTTFYIVPVFVVVSAISVVVFLVLAFVFVPRMVRSYNRRVVRRANGRRR